MAEQGQGLRWCIYPGCQFYGRTFEALEKHVVDAHGAQPGKPRPKWQEQPEQLFDRSEFNART